MADPMDFLAGSMNLQRDIERQAREREQWRIQSDRVMDELAESVAAKEAEETERHERAEQRETELLEWNAALAQQFADFVSKVDRDRSDDQQRLERAEQRELEALGVAKDSRRVAWISAVVAIFALLVAIIAIVVPMVWSSNQADVPAVAPSVSVPVPTASPTSSDEAGLPSDSPLPSAS
ncbi:hypothetical protein [Micromonospora sp. DH14]|uniref:hypothetical protein n=1 Tax=Micromonospora sp. DH14 TaxID=3040120 RepID=UPI0024430EEA|nr:hypothetical protein [Micromonospora sp. DH14]MDG9677939.1 hypothetical protein [Micromonospora sp. DH14]